MIEKIYLLIRSISLYCFYKVKYVDKIEMAMVNSIRGCLKLNIGKASSIKISSKFRSMGPLYLTSQNGGNITIGDRCFFNHNVSITSLDKITIGSDCMIANNVVIVDHNHRVEGNIISHDNFDVGKVTIGNNVWIGANTTILKGVTIGDGVVIGANSVITKSIMDHEVVAGVPAKRIRCMESED